MMGKLVYEKILDSTDLMSDIDVEVKNLAPAIYMLKVIGDDIIITRKIEKK